MATTLQLAPDETARQKIGRLRRRRRRSSLGASSLDACCEVPGVVELIGPSRAAKTELLMHAALTHALPAECSGEGAKAVYIDFDSRLSLTRLRSIAESRCRAAGLSEAALEAALNATLARVQLARCGNHLDLLVTLELIGGTTTSNNNSNGRRRSPPVWVSATEEQDDEEEESSLVLLDSVGDLWRDEKLRGTPSLLPAISRAVGRLGAPLLVAKPVLFASKRKRNNEEYMPRDWARLVRRRIFLNRRDSGVFHATDEAGAEFSFNVTELGADNFTETATTSAVYS